ncbi:MAG: zinc protease [Bdellovibrionaceae bacterium]|nr:zinc protease [Pseudobdellovibrionaceae bacterium]|tara:strand:+ start:178648 stop:181239 length:2592 start_codon:yes stop_codon:yes gene_type:complete
MYKKMQLKNGMNVIFVESHKAPVVSVQMWVKTGSADEQKGEEGISHFIEHLVFKGTEKYGVGEIASTVEGSGGQLNAYTSFDQTVFYVTISKQFTEVALDVVSQMMGFPKFDEEEINNEREVVIEEIKRGLDSPSRVASQQLFSTLYKKHPYGIPVIGYEKVIRKVTKKTLVDYYHRRYVPENMTLVVTGDMNASDMKKQVKEYFGPFKDYALKKVKRKKEEKIDKPRIQVKQSSFRESTLYISWPVPKVTHKDIPALDVLGLILGQGDSSRLTQSMRIRKPLVNHVSSSAFTPIDPGFFTITASVNPATFAEALETLNKTLKEFYAELPTKGEMKKALINMESDEYYTLETVDGLARKVGTYQHLFDDHKYSKEFLKQIKSLTAEDIMRVARKYLKPEKACISFLTDQDEKEMKGHLKKWLKDYKKVYESGKKLKIPKQGKKIKLSTWKPKKSEELAELKKVTLDCGAELIMYPSNETAVVSMKVAFLGGLRMEPEDKVGASELLSRVWTSGTPELSEYELSEKLDTLAASISAFAGRNTTGISMTALTPYASEVRDLFFTCLYNDEINQEALDREKHLMMEQIRKRDDNPTQQCVLQFSQSLYGNHPYSRDPLGSTGRIQSITAEDLIALRNQFMNLNNCKIVLAGSFDEKEWIEVLNQQFSKMNKGKNLSTRFEFNPPAKRVEKIKESDKEQAHIIVGFPGLTFEDRRKFTLEVIQAILAGQGGRLFLELRDKESLAYSVSPIKMEGIDAGYFGAYIGCSPEKSNKAIEMMFSEFDKLESEKVGEAELTRAKRYLIGRHDIDLQRTSTIASSLLFDEIYGIAAEETFQYADFINAVTSEDIQTLAKDIFSQPPVISRVGR